MTGLDPQGLTLELVMTGLLVVMLVYTALDIKDRGVEWIGLATLGSAAVAMVVGSLAFPDRQPLVEVDA